MSHEKKDVFQEIRDGLGSLGNKVNSLFEDYVAGDDGTGEIKVRADIYRSKTHYVIQVELPGLSKKEVSLQIHEDVIRVKGDKVRADETFDADFKRKERQFGSFIRNFELPHDADPKKIKAKFSNGVLTIKFPLSEEKPAEEETESIDID